MIQHKQRWLVIGVVILLLVSSAGAYSIIFTAGTGTTIESDDGMRISLSGDTQLSDQNPTTFANTVNLSTGSGQITFVANGPANASIAPADIHGTHTNLTAVDASTTALTANPNDKGKLTVDGAVTEIAWTDYAADDGTVDTVITGPDGSGTDITYYGLAANSTFTAVNASSGTALDVQSSDSNGQITFSIDHSDTSIRLQSGDQSTAPTQSNASPTGELTGSPSELSVDIGDADFPDDSVTVDIALDGSQLTSTSITQNETVTASVPESGTTGGEHTWTVSATDRLGNQNVQQYSYQVPSKVYIYNVTSNATGGHELIDDPVTVEATFAGSDETVRETETSDGAIDFSGLPPDESYVITIDADGYFTRSVYVPSLYDQSAVFLLNESQPSVTTQVQLTDRTGRYSDTPVLQVQRVINESNVGQMSDTGYRWVTISGERVSATNFIITDLEKNSVNRFVVVNEQGDRRVLGEYVAKTNTTATLEIGSISYKFENETSGYQWTANIDNSTGSPYIEFAYNDYENLTDSVQMEIKYRDNGTVIRSETFRNGPYGEIVYTEPISQSQYNNNDFVVEWSADRDGEQIGAERPVGGQRVIDFGALDDFWITAGYSLIALLLAFAVGAGISPGAGGLAVAGWMGLGWFIGAIPDEIDAGVIILAFLIAAWTTVNEQDPEVVG